MILTNTYVLVSFLITASKPLSKEERIVTALKAGGRRHVQTVTNVETRIVSSQAYQLSFGFCSYDKTFECRLIRHVKTWQGNNPVSLMSLHGQRL